MIDFYHRILKKEKKIKKEKRKSNKKLNLVKTIKVNIN